MKKILIILFVIINYTIYSQANVKIIDFIEPFKLQYSSAGALLLKSDNIRNRIAVANALSSTISIIDGFNDEVMNIPIGVRAFQHLKNESITISNRTGKIYLIGDKAVAIIEPDNKSSKKFNTDVQYESITVNENTEIVAVCGREDNRILIINAQTNEVKYIDWVNHKEKLINLNQTPPPPIRKVIFDNSSNRLIAIDGFESKIYIINYLTGEIEKTKTIALNPGGRWHLAGYNQNTRFLYLVIEKSDRKVIQSAKIDIFGISDIITKLPEYTEGVSMLYDAKRDKIYIPYDNHATIHVVDFLKNGEVREIPIPTFGNNASALDEERGLLFIGSWALGEIYIIDIKNDKFIRKIENLGIIPHMFAFAYLSQTRNLYFPIGASAVNGTFGSAITKLNTITYYTRKIYPGWSPIDLIEIPSRASFLVFNNEDEFAEVTFNGEVSYFKLPFDFPITCDYSPDGAIYLSYGPHQSYWPTVYIWGAKNGLLKIPIKPKDVRPPGTIFMAQEQFGDFRVEDFYDRRIPRQAMKIALDKNGELYLTQNCWGREPQFLNILSDGIRYLDINERIITGDTIERENTQRVLKYDSPENKLYLARIGENDDETSIIHIISTENNKILKRIEVGKGITDLIFNDKFIHTADFSNNTITKIDKSNYSVEQLPCDDGPLKLCNHLGNTFVINHNSNSLQQITNKLRTWKIPFPGNPNNLISWKGQIIITQHSNDKFMLISFNPTKNEFKKLFEFGYPYGDTRFSSVNNSFYLTGQFGDAIYDIAKMKIASDNSLWVTDLLAGKLYIVQ